MGWSPAEVVAETVAGSEPLGLTVAVGDGGHAAIGWSGRLTGDVVVTMRAPGGGWSAPAIAAPAVGIVPSPALAVGPRGELIATWLRRTPHSPATRRSLPP